MRIFTLSILIFYQFIALAQSHWSHVFDTAYVKKHKIHCIEMDIPLLKTVDSDFFHHGKVCFTEDGLPASIEYFHKNRNIKISCFYDIYNRLERKVYYRDYSYRGASNSTCIETYKYDTQNRLIQTNESCTPDYHITIKHQYTWFGDTLTICKNTSDDNITFDTLKRDERGNVIYHSFGNLENPSYTADAKELISSNHITYSYNNQDKLINIIDQRVTYITLFYYNEGKQLTKIGQDKTTINFDYAPNGFLKSEEIIADSPNTKDFVSNYKVSYQYTIRK